MIEGSTVAYECVHLRKGACRNCIDKALVAERADAFKDAVKEAAVVVERLKKARLSSDARVSAVAAISGFMLKLESMALPPPEEKE